jgi:pteridine reductase
MSLSGKVVLITGSARRIGRTIALGVARAGADVIIHHGNSAADARLTANEIELLGRKAWIIQANLDTPTDVERLIESAFKLTNVFGLVNNAAIFGSGSFEDTTLVDWQTHLNINLTAPFLLSQGYNRLLPKNEIGRIVNILDWRALRPGSDHFAYTVSKAALAALTKSLAQALAPRIIVNGIALGAILPPSDGGSSSKILEAVPAKRWARLEEVEQTALFLLEGPEYITGEIIHLDGGRHLV